MSLPDPRPTLRQLARQELFHPPYMPFGGCWQWLPRCVASRAHPTVMIQLCRNQCYGTKSCAVTKLAHSNDYPEPDILPSISIQNSNREHQAAFDHPMPCCHYNPPSHHYVNCADFKYSHRVFAIIDDSNAGPD